MLSRTILPFKRVVSSSRSFSTKVLVLSSRKGETLDSSCLNVLKAANTFDDAEVDLLITGTNCDEAVTKASTYAGVKRILKCNDKSYNHELAEITTDLITDLVKKNNYSHIISASNAYGKDLIPRVGMQLDVQPITDIIKINNNDTFVRPIYAGNAIATVQSLSPIKVMTVRTTAFDPMDNTAANDDVEIIDIDAVVSSDYNNKQWISDELTISERPELTSANVIVSGGRGVGSMEGFKSLEKLADSMNGAMGASRAAVDAGFCGNDLQVGQTGKVVAPDLYVAVGISGAIQHVAGMKDSKTIVAINKDPDAPIFQVSDYGIVGDLFKVVPELTKAIESSK